MYSRPLPQGAAVHRLGCLGDKVLYSLYGPDARRYFFYYFLHMATPIEIIIDGQSKRFSNSDLGEPGLRFIFLIREDWKV